MRLEGIHHVTAITGDAPGNVDFYVRVLGLRLVKKTVNQDDPTVYHLFYADERGSAGADITFFEYPGARRGRAGAGMVHRVVFRVASEEALDFWAERLAKEGVSVSRADGSLTLRRPRGARPGARSGRDRRRAADRGAARRSRPSTAPGLRPRARAHARPRGEPPLPRGVARLRRRAARPASRRAASSAAAATSTTRRSRRGIPGAGTVHHVAWASTPEEHEAWRERASSGGARPTPVIDRFYFKSIYFREPSGVLFEIATIGPGFTTDEPLETLGERLSLPPDFEHLREQVEPVLTPITEPARQLGAALSLESRTRPAAGEPDGALVLFHGRGTDENDLFPLLDALDPERRLHGVTPRGPLSLPPGGAALVRPRRARLSARGHVPALVPRGVGLPRRARGRDRDPAGANRARRLLAGRR